jgi:hypothetical protein
MTTQHTTTGAANNTAAQIVRYASHPRRTREGIIIEGDGNRVRVHWVREFYAHTGDQAFPINVRTWVAKQRLTFINNPIKSLRAASSPADDLQDVAECIIAARDFCGSEKQAIRDWETDNRNLTQAEKQEARLIADSEWNNSRASAGVVSPIGFFERHSINAAFRKN